MNNERLNFFDAYKLFNLFSRWSLEFLSIKTYIRHFLIFILWLLCFSQLFAFYEKYLISIHSKQLGSPLKFAYPKYFIPLFCANLCSGTLKPLESRPHRSEKTCHTRAVHEQQKRLFRIPSISTPVAAPLFIFLLSFSFSPSALLGRVYKSIGTRSTSLNPVRLPLQRFVIRRAVDSEGGANERTTQGRESRFTGFSYSVARTHMHARCAVAIALSANVRFERDSRARILEPAFI